MSELQWEVVYETNGPFQAEMLRGLLEAQGIPVFLSQEGAGRVYGLTVGALGLTQILVPLSHAEQARAVLKQYESGAGFGDETPDNSENLDESDDEIDES